MNNKELKKHIKDIETFTQEYWWKQLWNWTNSEKAQLDTPTYGAIIEDIIRVRSLYVQDLLEKL